MTQFLEIAERAAREAGRILLEWRSRIQPQEKAPRDLVTEADLASQNRIREVLLGAFPQHGFLGEEDLTEAYLARPDARDGRPPQAASTLTDLLDQHEFVWVVDPLDGTANYVHRLPTYAVSISLHQGPQTVAGVVFDPESRECYTAQAGQGARLNGRRLTTSRVRQLEEALIAASFSAHVGRQSPEIARFVEVTLRCQAVRRLGSAALNLAYLAAGRVDGYFATSVKTWDVSAGLLLVEEAGGVCTGLAGGSIQLDDPQLVAASTPALHQQLLDAVSLS